MELSVKQCINKVRFKIVKSRPLRIHKATTRRIHSHRCNICGWYADILEGPKEPKWIETVFIINVQNEGYECSDYTVAHTCVGIKITRSINCDIFLHQEFFIRSLLGKFNMVNNNSISLPSDVNQKLRIQMCLMDDEKNDFEPYPYQQLVDLLLFLVQGTRPDIAFSVTNVSRFNSCFGKAHWQAFN